MHTLGVVLSALVALLHVWFFVLESFLWRSAYARRAFRMSEEKAAMTAQLAQNQGVYNAFLAAGIAWGLLSVDQFPRTAFFLACVVIAGIVGAITASRAILYVQAIPGALALATLWLSQKERF